LGANIAALGLREGCIRWAGIGWPCNVNVSYTYDTAKHEYFERGVTNGHSVITK